MHYLLQVTGASEAELGTTGTDLSENIPCSVGGGVLIPNIDGASSSSVWQDK